MCIIFSTNNKIFLLVSDPLSLLMAGDTCVAAIALLASDAIFQGNMVGPPYYFDKYRLIDACRIEACRAELVRQAFKSTLPGPSILYFFGWVL